MAASSRDGSWTAKHEGTTSEPCDRNLTNGGSTPSRSPRTTRTATHSGRLTSQNDHRPHIGIRGHTSADRTSNITATTTSPPQQAILPACDSAARREDELGASRQTVSTQRD